MLWLIAMYVAIAIIALVAHRVELRLIREEKEDDNDAIPTDTRDSRTGDLHEP
jgi:hypothetical protein